VGQAMREEAAFCTHVERPVKQVNGSGMHWYWLTRTKTPGLGNLLNAAHCKSC
jgi:hypothetical protein